jgi:hypothetical protein
MRHNAPMGLLKKFLGGKEGAQATSDTAPGSLQFHETDTSDETAARNGPRRELVQTVLREAMRKHGIPSDWIECRTLAVLTPGGKPGMHVHFVVRQAHDRLLSYVFPFQDSFQRDISRLEPRASDWMLSIAWEFPGHPGGRRTAMPDPSSWAADRAAAAKADSAATEALEAQREADTQSDADDVEEDLQALYAIRDAALAAPVPPEQPDFEPTRPGFDEPDLPRR